MAGAAEYEPPFHSSRQDQKDYRHGDPHYELITIGDADSGTPGLRTAAFRAYNGTTLYTGVFSFNAAGTLTLTLNTPGATTVMTASPTLQSFYIPATFSSPVTISDASTAALILSAGGIRAFGPIEADEQGAIRRFQVGTTDAYGRRLIYYSGTNDPDPYDAGGAYAGAGPILVLGCCQADGWSDNVISEGMTCWGQDSSSNPMTNLNYAYARIKPSRFQLRHDTSAGVGGHDVFRVSNSGITWRPPDTASNVLTVDSTGLVVSEKIEADEQASIHRFQVGTSDAFNRRLIYYSGTNDADPADAGGGYVGDGPILVLGCCGADGWSDNVISEGMTCWGQDSSSNPLSNANFAYARIKPSRFQLRHHNGAGVGSHDVFRVSNSGITWRPPDTASDVLTVDATGLNVAGNIQGKSIDLSETSVQYSNRIASITTLDATSTPIIGYLTTTNYAYTIKVLVVFSRASDGSTGSYSFTYKCKNVAGVVTNSGAILVGSIIDGGIGACTVSLGVSGTTSNIIATGLAGSTIRWGGRMKLLEVPL